MSESTSAPTEAADDRSRLIAEVAGIVCAAELGHPVRVAVDGITASGKTTFARELTDAVRSLGRPAIHVTMDGFHHSRARRHKDGRASGQGYYDDAFDFAALAEHVLIPLGPGGSLRYRTRIRDLATDRALDEDPLIAPADAVVVVDGSFLQRPEIRDHWDQRIWIATAFEVARARGTKRDAERLGGLDGAGRLFDERYHAAARIYLAAVGPAEQATLIVENDDVTRPVLRRP